MIPFFKKLFNPTYPTLSGEAFTSTYKGTKGAILIDVRTAGEFKNGSIRGARNLDIMLPSFQRHIETLDKNKTYFVFCRSGGRSKKACKQMVNHGLTVYNLKGGMPAWQD